MGIQLFIADTEIARRLGLTPQEFRTKSTALERSGFPQQDAQFNNRRYWPAVKAFLDRRYGLDAGSTPSNQPEGEENWT